MVTINIFCDASIDIDKHIACAGCIITNQNTSEQIGSRYVIQQNATNNSAEILAIWLGISEAILLKNSNPNIEFSFRLFSDSKISLYGIRDWIFNWINNMTPDGVLISSSGQPVMNQQCFIDIYNMIVDNNLHIRLYHQRGHVVDGKVGIEKAKKQFVSANKIPPERIGLSMEIISNYNNIVDTKSREAVKAYINEGILIPNTEMELINPLSFGIQKDKVDQYKRCISRNK